MNVKKELLDTTPTNKIQSYVRDVFLSCGRVYSKHIEFVFGDIDNARIFSDLLASYDIFPKLNQDKYIKVFVRSRECICNLLALVGANKSLMDFNNQIAMRELRNDANRRANCDARNIERQVATAQKQLEIIRNLNFDTMDPKLKQVATIRLQYPNDSMEELAKKLNISKSGLAHRLRRLTT